MQNTQNTKKEDTISMKSQQNAEGHCTMVVKVAELNANLCSFFTLISL